MTANLTHIADEAIPIISVLPVTHYGISPCVLISDVGRGKVTGKLRVTDDLTETMEQHHS